MKRNFIFISLFLWSMGAIGQPFNNSWIDYSKPYYKYFHSGEINLPVNDGYKKIISLKEIYQDAEISEFDGLSIEYPDFWFNVRVSNTEPLLRLNLEARTKEIMEQKRDEVLRFLKKDQS